MDLYEGSSRLRRMLWNASCLDVSPNVPYGALWRGEIGIRQACCWVIVVGKPRRQTCTCHKTTAVKIPSRSRIRDLARLCLFSSRAVVLLSLVKEVPVSASASVIRFPAIRRIRLPPYVSGWRVMHIAVREGSLVYHGTGRQCHLFTPCLLKSIVGKKHQHTWSELLSISRSIQYDCQYFAYLCAGHGSSVSSTKALD